MKPDSSAKQMVNFVRHEVNIESQDVPVCITGANFLLSDTGGVVLTENEGNILKSTSMAKMHIVNLFFSIFVENPIFMRSP